MRVYRAILIILLFLGLLFLPATICDDDDDETEWTTPVYTPHGPTPDYSED